MEDAKEKALEQGLKPVPEEDTVEKQGIHALHRGYMARPGERTIDFLFPPSCFAEAVFALTPRAEKRRLFNELIVRIEKNSNTADNYPGIVEWIEGVRKNGRKYWSGKPELANIPDYGVLEHDILHFDIGLVLDKNVGERVGRYKIVHVDELGRCYFDVDGRMIQAHRHLYSANLSRAVQIRALTGGKGEAGIFSEETPYGNFNLRVKSKRGGRQKDTLSFWLVSLSNPFEADLEDRFMIDNQADFEVYTGSKGQLWCNYDTWILQKLEELEKQKGISAAQRETKIIGFHTAVALTELFLEKRKQPDKRKAGFLTTDEGKEVIMPYLFVDNPILVFEPVVERYGLGKHYEEIDDMLLDNKYITSNQFRRLKAVGNASLEVVKNIRGMVLPETRHIIQRQHLELTGLDFRFSGFAVDLDESRGEKGFRTIGVVYTGKGGKAVYVLYDDKIVYPLLHFKDFSKRRISSLYGDEPGNNTVKPARLELFQHPMLQLGRRFEERDYRTGEGCEGWFEIPSVLTEDEKRIYQNWEAKLKAQ